MVEQPNSELVDIIIYWLYEHYPFYCIKFSTFEGTWAIRIGDNEGYLLFFPDYVTFFGSKHPLVSLDPLNPEFFNQLKANLECQIQ